MPEVTTKNKNLSAKFSKYLSIKSITTYSFLNYFQAGISFLLSFLLARHLGKEQYGLYAYGIVFANTISVMIQFGMERTLVRDMVQFKNPSNILLAATGLKGIISCFLVIPVLIWASFFAGFEDTKVWIVSLMVISGTIWGFSPKAWFDFTGKIHRHALITLTGRLLFVGGALLILFFYTNSQVVSTIIAVLLLSRLLVAILEWSYVYQTIDFEWKNIQKDIKWLFQENRWVWLAAMGNLMMTQANQLILEGVRGTGELGLFAFAFQIIALIRLLQIQVLRLSTPAIAKVTMGNDKKVLRRNLLQYCLLTFGLTIALITPLYFIAPWAIKTFVGVDFLGSIPILNILLIWISTYGIASISSQFLLSFRMQRTFFYVTLFYGILSLGLAYFFINKYLAIGAALSLLVAHSSSALTMFFLVLRKINSKDDSISSEAVQ